LSEGELENRGILAMTFNELTPMPQKFGVGFTSQTELGTVAATEELTGLCDQYRHEKVGRYHNYHFTPAGWMWPVAYDESHAQNLVIDGFSPNLNKELHVGHLRNLAVANALQGILCLLNVRCVALLGASLGVKKAAVDGWKFWTQFVGYHPEVFYDITMPLDAITPRDPTKQEIEEKKIELLNIGSEEYPLYAAPKVWDGPNGCVIVARHDGRPLYAYYDAVFAKEVGPTHYITGQEQQEHFNSLGLGDKHLSMGLVLGEDGKKIKSRTGDALPAVEAMKMVQSHLRDVPEERGQKIAWNILCWNFLHAARETNLKFEVEKWVRADAPGMYVTYTYARVISALHPLAPIEYDSSVSDPLLDQDVKLLGLAEQSRYYQHKATVSLDPAPIANYAHDLARAIGKAYETEKIRDGRPAFVGAIRHAMSVLGECMSKLGMFCLDKV
jgi:hypothetical protein